MSPRRGAPTGRIARGRSAARPAGAARVARPAAAARPPRAARPAWPLALALAAALLLGSAPAASAHPLGNFSTNRLTVVRVSEDRVDVRYVLDLAEIPTFRDRGKAPASVLAAKRAEVLRGLRVTTAGGRSVVLRARGPGRIAFPPGQGGLKTTRIELLLGAPAATRGDVVVRDTTFAGRVGWRAVVVRPGDGTAVRSDVPATDPTRGLRVYPGSVLDDPADRGVARLTVEPGAGTVSAPDGDEGGPDRGRGTSDGLSGAFSDAAAGEGVLVFLLLAAFGWGALHALSPGHGKAMVAAYLVGTRGTARDAVALGGVVTVTHTIGVFALGLVTLALSAYVLPEQLYPWLNLVSGLLVVLVGLAVLRARIRGRRTKHDHGHDHHHHGHDHHDGHHHHHGHDHHHDHHHHGSSPRELLAMGASAGLIPCPSALVVLLAAIAQAQVALGLALIVAFSAGLAATLTVLGLAVVWAGGLAGRIQLPARLQTAATTLPAISAAVIIIVGAVLTAQAVPDLM